MIVPVFLFSYKLLSRPNFYVSAYLERHREAYYDRLLGVASDGDWTGWCEFFLRALIAQAEENQRKAHDILALYSQRKPWILAITRSQHAIRALDWVFSRPIFSTSDFVGSAGIPSRTAHRILGALRDEGLIQEVTPYRGSRAAIYAVMELLNIAEGGAP